MNWLPSLTPELRAIFKVGSTQTIAPNGNIWTWILTVTVPYFLHL